MNNPGQKTITHFSCSCGAYGREGWCEHADIHVRVLAEKAPHLIVVLDSYEAARDRQRRRDREYEYFHICRRSDLAGVC